jgi:hypothetical protein
MVPNGLPSLRFVWPLPPLQSGDARPLHRQFKSVLVSRWPVSRAEGVRLSINFSTGRARGTHASDVLGVCVMITSALQ